MSSTLASSSEQASTYVAEWSPNSQMLALVDDQDLYIRFRNQSLIRLTTSAQTFNGSFYNGMGDWVYQEEVLNDARALWWSPDSSKLAFLEIDDRAVEL
jgi:dipeptidyl aminopeptidase